MQKRCSKNQPSFFLCIALIVVMALFTGGCSGGAGKGADSSVGAAVEDGAALGDGETQFSLTVVDQEGTETELEIHTDKEMVGEALTELGVIDGEEGDYGLYVKTVNGITVDYDEDGVYWAFYVDGEYAQTGVDTTPITEGGSYAFKVE